MNPSQATPASHSKSGIVFLVHGTRNKAAQPVIMESLERLRLRFAESLQLPQEAVIFGFLEIMPPLLDEALETLCQMGKTEIRILPLLLFPGGHLNEDIPNISRQVMEKYPGVRINTGNCIGVDEPEFMDILMKRL